MTKKYTVSKGTNDGNLAFAWQLSCNGKHVQWFSDESIARKTCDELTSIELIKENTKAETVTEFADRCRECGTHLIPISVLEDIKAEIKEWYWQTDKQYLAKDPCVVDAMIDLFIRTIDKYKAETDVEDGDALPNDERSKTCTKCVSFSNTCRICHNRDMYKEHE